MFQIFIHLHLPPFSFICPWTNTKRKEYTFFLNKMLQHVTWKQWGGGQRQFAKTAKIIRFGR